MSRLLGALEMGGTKMVCATGRADGEIVERVRIDTADPASTLEACGAWFAERGVEALGVGAFGPTDVDPASPHFGCMLTTPKPGWSNIDVLGALSSAIDVPVGYDTDVNAACLGEAVHGCARGLRDVLYLTIGTGVGAGVLVEGNLLHGAMHPEAGHIPLTRDPADPMPSGESSCPFHTNCLEGLVCGPSLWKRWGGSRRGRRGLRPGQGRAHWRVSRPGACDVCIVLHAPQDHRRRGRGRPLAAAAASPHQARGAAQRLSRHSRDG